MVCGEPFLFGALGNLSGNSANFSRNSGNFSAVRGSDQEVVSTKELAVGESAVCLIPKLTGSD